MSDRPALVRLNIAARELGIAPKTVRKYCHCKYLKCKQLPSGHWRVYREALDALHHELKSDAGANLGLDASQIAADRFARRDK